MALSPAMVFYSRMFIQESLFACFTLAFVIAVGRVATGGGRAWWILAGVAAGLAAATKETSAIVLPAALAACAIAWWSLGSARPRERADRRRLARACRREPRRGGSRRGAVLFVVLRGAGGRSSSRSAAPAPTSLAASIPPATRTRGITTCACSPTPRPAGSTWSEGLVLVLAVVGAVTAWRRAGSLASRRRVLGSLSRLRCRHRRGDLLGDSVQDAVEPAAVLRRARSCSPASGSRRSSSMRAVARDARRARGGPRAGVLPAGMAGLARGGDLRGRPAQSRTSTPRPSPTPCAWPRASAISPRFTPTARACRYR